MFTDYNKIKLEINNIQKNPQYLEIKEYMGQRRNKKGNQNIFKSE